MMRADDLAVMTTLALFLSGLCLGWWARGVVYAFVETLAELRAWIARRRENETLPAGTGSARAGTNPGFQR